MTQGVPQVQGLRLLYGIDVLVSYNRPCTLNDVCI